MIPAAVWLLQLLKKPFGLGQGVVLLLLCLLIGVGLRTEARQRRCASGCEYKTLILSGLCAGFAALATYYLAQAVTLGPIVASGIVGLAAHFILGRYYAYPAYAGVFVGMSSPLVLPSYALVGVAGLFTGFLYQYLDGVFDGIGGRLGTMAAVAVLITLLLTGGGWI